MVELSPRPGADEGERESLAVGFGGDTFNTAIYLARTGVSTEYATLLGDDPYSEKILRMTAKEGIGSEMMPTMPGRQPGLYLIRNDPDGEREFYYWRKEARARELFAEGEDTKQLIEQLQACDYIYLSGITLAIISDHSRLMLLRFLKQYRRSGGKVCFDINYRPRLWETNREKAQYLMLDVMENCDMALLTLDDEELLWDEGSVEATLKRYEHCGIEELVLKRGAEDVVIYTEGGEQRVPVPKVNGVVDTTGAGDSFNAGYIAGRLQGLSHREAALHGCHVASIVIRNRGAIVERKRFESLYRGLSS